MIGLVQQHVVEHAAERVAGLAARIGDRRLDGLADGDPEAARGVRGLGEDGAADLGLGARRRDAAPAPGLHHDLAERFLVKAHPDHEDPALEPHEGARIGQRAAPLAGAGLGAQPLDPELLVVPGLGDGGVGLVTAGRRDALVLVVDPRRRAERLLQRVGPPQGRRPPAGQQLEDAVRDVDPAVLTDLLLDEVHGEDRRQGVRADGLPVGSEGRRRRFRQIGGEVVPLAGHFFGREQDLRVAHSGVLQKRKSERHRGGVVLISSHYCTRSRAHASGPAEMNRKGARIARHRKKTQRRKVAETPRHRNRGSRRSRCRSDRHHLLIGSALRTQAFVPPTRSTGRHAYCAQAPPGIHSQSSPWKSDRSSIRNGTKPTNLRRPDGRAVGTIQGCEIRFRSAAFRN